VIADDAHHGRLAPSTTPAEAADSVVAPPLQQRRISAHTATVERARQREFEATRRLRQLIHRREERYAEACRLMTAYDARLEGTRASLRRTGYLVKDGTNR
jgi:hypothetical protein